MAKLKFPFEAKLGKKRKAKKDWKVIAIIGLLLGNFAWDAYNRVDQVKVETDKLIQVITKE